MLFIYFFSHSCKDGLHVRLLACFPGQHKPFKIRSTLQNCSQLSNVTMSYYFLSPGVVDEIWNSIA